MTDAPSRERAKVDLVPLLGTRHVYDRGTLRLAEHSHEWKQELIKHEAQDARGCKEKNRMG